MQEIAIPRIFLFVIFSFSISQLEIKIIMFDVWARRENSVTLLISIFIPTTQKTIAIKESIREPRLTRKNVLGSNLKREEKSDILTFPNISIDSWKIIAGINLISTIIKMFSASPLFRCIALFVKFADRPININAHSASSTVFIEIFL